MPRDCEVMCLLFHSGGIFVTVAAEARHGLCVLCPPGPLSAEPGALEVPVRLTVFTRMLIETRSCHTDPKAYLLVIRNGPWRESGGLMG